MFAYVKEVGEGLHNPYSYVHTSRIFHYEVINSGKNKGKRVKFNSEKWDINTSYGIVQGKEIIKHQILLVKDTEEELKAIVDSQEIERLRKIPCPKRLSTGPTREPLRNYTLVEEAQNAKATETRKVNAKRKVEDHRNAKLIQALNKKGLVKPNDNADPQPTPVKVGGSGPPEKKSKAENTQVDETTSLSIVTISEQGATTTSMASASIAEEMEVKSPPKVLENPMDLEVCQFPEPVAPSVKCDECSSLGKQLQLALMELEEQRMRCSELEEEKKQSLAIETRLEKIETDIGIIKDFMGSAKVRADSRKQATYEKPCALSRLKDVSPIEQQSLEIPQDQVHLGEGKYFISKVQLVKSEKAKGLRPRLKKLLTYMYKKDLPNWICKSIKGSIGKEIPEQHIKAFIGVLKVMEWKKEVKLTYDHVSREVSKALSELKADGYPHSDVDEETVDNPPPPKPPVVTEDKEEEVIALGEVDDNALGGVDDKKATVNPLSPFHEDSEDGQ